MKITIKQISCLILATTTIALVGCTTPTRYGRSTGEYIDDKTVTSKVKSALNRDSLTDGTQIEVQTFRGNVHLTGFVQHPIQKEQASQIARRVAGVQYFKNDIVVQSELPTVRAMQQQSTMREPSGAEIEFSSERRSNFRGSGTSSSWERGSYNAYGPRSEFREPSGAEAEISVEREGVSGRETEIETETKVEKE